MGAVTVMAASDRAHAVKSMTGFARVSGSLPGVDVDLEVRAVNSRYLELSIKGVSQLGALERELKAIFQRRHSRGRIDLAINRRVATTRRAPGANDETTDALIAAYASTCRRYGAPAEGLAHFIGSLILREGYGAADSVEMSDAELQLLKELCEKASGALFETRMTEGASLVAEITPRVHRLQGLTEAVQTQMSGAPERVRERLLERLKQLAPEIVVNPERLALEVALLADRIDVTEEVSRLTIHIGQFLMSVQQGSVDGVGRRLDFLTQEIGRELNTIGSKAQDAMVQGHIVEAKAELEKIREQVQNIE